MMDPFSASNILTVVLYNYNIFIYPIRKYLKQINTTKHFVWYGLSMCKNAVNTKNTGGFNKSFKNLRLGLFLRYS